MRWAIVEVMGHQRHAGQVYETTLAGVPMLRVLQPGRTATERKTEWRSPAGEKCDGFDHNAVLWECEVTVRYPEVQCDLGGAALFRVTTCSEATARAWVDAGRCNHGPEEPERIEGPWRPERRALPGPVEDAEELEDLGPVDEDSDPAGHVDLLDGDLVEPSTDDGHAL
jgi:hypothetical protein